MIRSCSSAKRATLPIQLHLQRRLTDKLRVEKPIVVKLATSILCSKGIQEGKKGMIQFSDSRTRLRFYDNFNKRVMNRSPLCPNKSIIAIQSHNVDDVFNTIKFIETEKEQMEVGVVSVGLILDRSFLKGYREETMEIYMRHFEIALKFTQGKNHLSESEFNRGEYLLLLEAPFHTDYEILFIALRELLDTIWIQAELAPPLQFDCVYEPIQLQ